ncbi:hypothetical protein EGI22_17575 [Lacihabitans sp. LS3-19]|uniref:prolipoprotein diacylglyceryl transferase n=1 Tax=Lacihabitans sp. LS3-19 TaxID=2487335 RepID=UPI0020CD252D|nr:prolipoprotein diacylglyceryl transferase family protein [Lacihabitans sp. LS3-19]MCP9769717.1 hypothetical protein [Lacihabitans sp. LS3-19]
MYPVIFNIDFWGLNFPIYSYSICIVLGTFLAAKYSKYYAKKTLDINLENNFYYLIFLGGFIGGKLLFWLENPGFYIQNPRMLLDISEGGFVFYGSLIFGVLVAIYYLKFYRLPIYQVLDIMVLAILIAHSFGRLGCFFGGCCYGIHTSSIFGLDFEASGIHNVFPIQLFEAISLGIIFIFLHNYSKKYSGEKIIIYLLSYGILRFSLEFFRADVRGFIIPNYLSHAQFISLISIVGTFIIYLKIKNKSISKHNS